MQQQIKVKNLNWSIEYVDSFNGKKQLEEVIPRVFKKIGQKASTPRGPSTKRSRPSNRRQP